MTSRTLKERTISGLIWNAIERFMVQGGQFIIRIMIARMITPAEYGLVGMVAVFLVLSDVIINGGFSQALIQKKDRSETDYSTVFYINLALSVVIYVLLYYSAPEIAGFYKDNRLIEVIRLISISIVIKSLSVVQIAKLSIELNFRLKTLVNFWAVLVSGVLAIYLAYAGYGVLALVYQAISYSAIVTILMFIVSKWRPKLVFSFSRTKELFNFGSKVFLASLTGVLSDNSYSILIGRLFSSKEVGFYAQGRNLPDLLSVNLFNVLQGVLFPVMAAAQDDRPRLMQIYKKSLDMTAFIVLPCMVGLVVIAEPFVRVFLTEKWLPSVYVIQWLALSRMIIPLGAINANLLNAIGRSDLYLKIDLIKLPLTVLGLIISAPFGMEAMVISNFVISILYFFINSYYPGKIFGYGSLRQLKDMLPIFIATAVMFFATFYIKIDNGLIDMVAKVFTGGIVYLISCTILKVNALSEVRAYIKGKINKRKMAGNIP
ncbi:lipopolysaccharide biosynthesis protein [Rahnella sikkimica]|uniref:Lipopolysaccharide biosynthesis protein n=1 Tax=Rahnella sikkimica TaxID=1805933 RepID=A0A2L1US40_9GAMM|nr:lipopolysaccharide biosynthesis protein [Rahnella sikkimica]AVF35761.1 lipopolysaccharide biosynthesis protein [Rahnella sikkimica]